MKIVKKQKGEIAVLRIGQNFAESDLELFEGILLATLQEEEKVLVNMRKTRSAECAEWQIANTLCSFVMEAAKLGKNVAIACLPTEILCKANMLKLGAKTRIFCQESAAITFLANAA